MVNLTKKFDNILQLQTKFFFYESHVIWMVH